MSTETPLRCVPPDIEVLFGVPPLLSTEDPRLYREMLDRFAGSVEPRNVIEWLWVKDIVDLYWEIARLRRYRALMIEKGARAKMPGLNMRGSTQTTLKSSSHLPLSKSRHVEMRRRSTLKRTPLAC